MAVEAVRPQQKKVIIFLLQYVDVDVFIDIDFDVHVLC